MSELDTILKEKLNPEQYAAATHTEGPLLVLAAAGTGKTQTLVYRVAHLIDIGFYPEQILLLTFTNKAANEMLDRAKKVTEDRSHGVWGGTFHSICSRILRQYAPRIGYGQDFTIADSEDSRRIMEKVIKELNVDKEHFPKKDILLSLYSKVRNTASDLDQAIEERFIEATIDKPTVKRAIELYQERKAELGLLDFDDLLVKCVELLETNPDVLEYYQQRFAHILVDEYQDTNIIQSKFVDLLAAKHRNITAVGDDFQCIYTWRGAEVENILKFDERYPGARIIKLERNYRSTPEILAVANACVDGATNQYKKTLLPTIGNGQKPVIVKVYDSAEQAYNIVNLVKELLEHGYSHSDISIIYRAHFHSIDLQLELTKARIPFIITSGLGVFESAHAKDLLAFLRLLVSSHDRLSFDRFFSIFPGLGSRSIEILWTRLGCQCNFQSTETRVAITSLLRPSVRGFWQTISDIIEAYFNPDNQSKNKVIDLTNQFIDQFYAAILRKKFDDSDDRIDDLHEIALQIEESASLSAFLQDVSLLTNVDTADRNPKSAIRLSSIHQAKGLEWPIVIIPWVVESMFPAGRSLEESENDAEERRLFYVGVTRAKALLYLFTPDHRKTFDGINIPADQSRFIKEIPKDLTISCRGKRRPRW